jgi:hypothetical protein
MPTIKLHLEAAEFNALARYADALHETPEAVVFCALNRLMLDARNPEIQSDIKQTSGWREANLPLWSDSAGSVHAYEGKADDDPEPSKYL